MSCSASIEWEKIETKFDDGLHDIEVINDNIAFAYTYGTGKFFRTKDGGNQWENIYLFDSIYFEQIQFFDKNNGWIIGSPQKILKTKDGGYNWRACMIESEGENSMIYMGCIFMTSVVVMSLLWAEVRVEFQQIYISQKMAVKTGS
jgi:photosystem II stability/assembly factor-like uncharacterized protein